MKKKISTTQLSSLMCAILNSTYVLNALTMAEEKAANSNSIGSVSVINKVDVKIKLRKMLVYTLRVDLRRAVNFNRELTSPDYFNSLTQEKAADMFKLYNTELNTCLDEFFKDIHDEQKRAQALEEKVIGYIKDFEDAVKEGDKERIGTSLDNIFDTDEVLGFEVIVDIDALYGFSGFLMKAAKEASKKFGKAGSVRWGLLLERMNSRVPFIIPCSWFGFSINTLIPLARPTGIYTGEIDRSVLAEEIIRTAVKKRK